jgi:hypothetical protein
MTDEELLQAFEAGTVPLEAWTHRQHLRVAYLYLCAHGFEGASERVRSGIQRLNAAHQVPEAIDRGYHETLTQGWLRLLWVTIYQYGPAANSDEFLDSQPQLCVKQALRFFYSRERMMSPEAKQGFVEPDLAPLPTPRKPST